MTPIVTLKSLLNKGYVVAFAKMTTGSSWRSHDIYVVRTIMEPTFKVVIGKSETCSSRFLSAANLSYRAICLLRRYISEVDWDVSQ